MGLNCVQVLLVAFSVQLQRDHVGPGTPSYSVLSQNHSLIQLHDKHINSEFTYFFVYRVERCIGVSRIINHTQINKDDMLVLLEIPQSL